MWNIPSFKPNVENIPHHIIWLVPQIVVMDLNNVTKGNLKSLN